MNSHGHKWTDAQVERARKPSYGKIHIIQPALISLLGNVKQKNILELGCGSGYWLRILSDKGAKCTGLDISENQIKVAKELNPENKITYLVADASKKINLKPNSFGIILLEKVLLEIPDLSKIKAIFKEAYRLLKKTGFLIVSEVHPFAPSEDFPNLEVEKDYNYFKSGAPISITATRPDGTHIKWQDFHWTLEDLITSMNKAGFKIAKLLEPRPDKEVLKKVPYLEYRKDKPLAILIKAEK